MEEKITQTKKQLLAEIFRFLLVGGTATVIDYAVFWALDTCLLPLILPQTAFWTAFSLILAVAGGFCVGLLINWILSVGYVFRQTKEKVDVRSKKDFLTFTVIGCIGLVINELGMLFLVWSLPTITILGATTFLSMEWKKWIAKCIVTCIVLVWNYIGRKKFIFKG